MKGFTDHLDHQTEVLIAIGAAVACGCQPCLHKLSEQAKTAEIPTNWIKSAAIIGQFVKEQPAAQMRALADEVFGTHLSRQDTANQGCPIGGEAYTPVGGCTC